VKSPRNWRACTGYETQYNILQSRALAYGFIDALNLKEHPFYKDTEKDYPDYSPQAMVGNPVRRTGWMPACGNKLTPMLQCPACGQQHEEGISGVCLKS
jgi:hypothetical protein